MADAQWTVTVPTSDVDGDGSVQVQIDLADNGAAQGVLQLTVTKGRVLSGLWTPADGSTPVTNRGIWSVG